MKHLAKAEKLQKTISEYLDSLEFKPTLKTCDHLCYVVKDIQTYNQVKKDYLKDNSAKVIREIGDSDKFRGKGFLILKLNNSITFMTYQVNILEIKFSNNPRFRQGWQHAEFIPVDSLAEIIDGNPNQAFEDKRMNNKPIGEIGVVINDQHSIKFRTGSIELA
jgi:predicted metalloenzyme YecM